MAPFFSTAKYMIGPFFSAKSIWLAPFFWISIWKAHFSDVSRYVHIFLFRDFFEATCSLGIQWTDCYICLSTSNKWVQKSKGSIWMGQHFRRSSIWMGPFFQRPGIWLGKVSKYWLEHPYHNYPQVTPRVLTSVLFESVWIKAGNRTANGLRGGGGGGGGGNSHKFYSRC